jgi:hypothetical protein
MEMRTILFILSLPSFLSVFTGRSFDYSAVDGYTPESTRQGLSPIPRETAHVTGEKMKEVKPNGGL